MEYNYDVIVVGGGHAGCEAAAAAANLGCKTLMITMDMTKIGQMSCNPAMGGVAKGQIVREIDALGGYSGLVSDFSAVQFRMLNQSKGPAMWSPRTQNDRMLFAEKWRIMLEQTPNVFFWQDMVNALIINNYKIEGVETSIGIKFYAPTVVVTSGTFLNGKIHIGEKNFGGGRAGEKASTGITEQLTKYGFEAGRMKTGTPPRVDGRSLDYSKMEEQKGDQQPSKFSYLQSSKPLTKQLSCFITYTNEYVHDLLREGFEKSPMFSGTIQGLGPRYCPSIEDKIERFSERNRHQIFVEPEGWNTVEIYVNGFSTSLPYEVQFNAIKQIPGFENVKIFRPGYAIEYDYFPPTQLNHTLETKTIEGLFLAGQINGTTGYEEAACQGLMAGINAALKVQEKEPFTLSRDEAYIGVLIDDLITKGTEEPYRMFTSRAEYRILLRQDNADLRLTEKAFKMGLAKEERMHVLDKKVKQIQQASNFIKNRSVAPNEINEFLENQNTQPLRQKLKIDQVIARPQVQLNQLVDQGIISRDEELNFISNDLMNEVLEQVEIDIKYSGYIEKEKEMAERVQKLSNITLADKIDYDSLSSLSSEAKEKLKKIKPVNIAQASRISGVSPADISVLVIHMSK